jgi:hypothetical protein
MADRLITRTAITGRKPNLQFKPTSDLMPFRLTWRDDAVHMVPYDVDHVVAYTDAFALIVEAEGAKWTQWIPRHRRQRAFAVDMVNMLRNLADDIEEAFTRIETADPLTPQQGEP